MTEGIEQGLHSIPAGEYRTALEIAWTQGFHVEKTGCRGIGVQQDLKASIEMKSIRGNFGDNTSTRSGSTLNEHPVSTNFLQPGCTGQAGKSGTNDDNHPGAGL